MNLEFMVSDAIPRAGVGEIAELLERVDGRHRHLHGVEVDDAQAIAAACERRLLDIDLAAGMRWSLATIRAWDLYLSPLPYFRGVAQ